MPSLTAVDRELSKSLYDQHVQNNYHLRIAKRANLFNEMKDMDGLGKVIEELREIPKFKLTMPKESGIIGVLSDFVKCNDAYSALKTFLFGNIILAEGVGL